MQDLPPVVMTFLAVLGAVGLGLALARLGLRVMNRWAKLTPYHLDDALVQHLSLPLHILLPLALLFPAGRIAGTDFFNTEIFSGGMKILIVAVIAWLAARVVRAVADTVAGRFDVTKKDNLRARQVHTQIAVARRIASFVIFLLAIASLFLMFESLRGIGVSLLASAVVAGIIIGFAAQKAIGNLLAGVQIALAQPIRLDDVVIVEGEWGRIEEITLTYVVVAIWDQRRLVVPISQFIEKPFQNWTRKTAEILGTVFLYVDYTVPVDAVRKKLKELLKDNPLWDGRASGVIVTDARPDCMELRVLVSAANASDAWDLRCQLREKLLQFLKDTYPDALPRQRVLLAGNQAA